MRLIDADECEDVLAIHKALYYGDSDYFEGISQGFNLATYDVKEAPTIEAEPIVRCKDCKFNYANQIPSDDVCQLCVELPISKDFFCAYGEKMNEVNDGVNR